MISKYEEFSYQRKKQQESGEAPDWLTTAGLQLLTNQAYLMAAETPTGMFRRVAVRAAELTKLDIPSDYGYDSWTDAFYDGLYKGWISASTPILTNMGNNRGHPIACSQTYLQDSIPGFYDAYKEIAVLTQNGYGTSWSLDNVRSRGSAISRGGTANGIMQPAARVVGDMADISQNTRRGSIGQYLNVLSKDFDELCDQILSDNDGWNVGWNIDQSFIDMFDRSPEDADAIWKKIMKTKMITGKGYLYFLDKVNNAAPQMYKDRGFKILGSNLCSEINLMCDPDHSYTCVLASMNISKFDEWKDTKAVQICTVLLDAVIEDMLSKARGMEGFERIVRFTEKSRAIGVGQLGQSTYFQSKGWVFGGLESRNFNKDLTRKLDSDTLEASKLLARELGEPEWLEGYGLRFSHRLAFAPTKSTAVIQGGLSEGTAPVFANVYEQDTAGGTVYRVNPVFLKLMKERDMYTKDVMKDIATSQGSVQGQDWLTDKEKAIFLTAFEVSQDTIIEMASDRQRIMNEGGGGQGQSTNLFFPLETTESEVSRLHIKALMDEHLQSLYYVHSLDEESKFKIDQSVCSVCEG